MSNTQIVLALPLQFDVSSSFFKGECLYLFYKSRAGRDLSAFGLAKINTQKPFNFEQYFIPKGLVGSSELEHSAQMYALNHQAAYFNFTRTHKPSDRPDSWKDEQIKIGFSFETQTWFHERKEHKGVDNILPNGKLISLPFDRKQGDICFRVEKQTYQIPIFNVLAEKFGSEINVNTNFVCLSHNPMTAFVIALVRGKSANKVLQGNIETLICESLDI